MAEPPDIQAAFDTALNSVFLQKQLTAMEDVTGMNLINRCGVSSSVVTCA